MSASVPIALGEVDAADALGLGRTTFRNLVEQGHLPPPRRVPGCRRIVWDRDELTAGFRSWNREGEEVATDEDESDAW
jgi:predicted DNA-binding transcriptional regulator AlpA